VEIRGVFNHPQDVISQLLHVHCFTRFIASDTFSNLLAGLRGQPPPIVGSGIVIKPLSPSSPVNRRIPIGLVEQQHGAGKNNNNTNNNNNEIVSNAAIESNDLLSELRREQEEDQRLQQRATLASFKPAQVVPAPLDIEDSNIVSSGGNTPIGGANGPPPSPPPRNHAMVIDRAVTDAVTLPGGRPRNLERHRQRNQFAPPNRHGPQHHSHDISNVNNEPSNSSDQKDDQSKSSIVTPPPMIILRHLTSVRSPVSGQVKASITGDDIVSGKLDFGGGGTGESVVAPPLAAQPSAAATTAPPTISTATTSVLTPNVQPLLYNTSDTNNINTTSNNRGRNGSGSGVGYNSFMMRPQSPSSAMASNSLPLQLQSQSLHPQQQQQRVSIVASVGSGSAGTFVNTSAEMTSPSTAMEPEASPSLESGGLQQQQQAQPQSQLPPHRPVSVAGILPPSPVRGQHQHHNYHLGITTNLPPLALRRGIIQPSPSSSSSSFGGGNGMPGALMERSQVDSSSSNT
jgi:hypothetical protein